jgi:hypothetical protein
MSKENIIKYTIVPANDKDDYESNFKLSLNEFAKAVDGNGKALVCPLIVYNADLDIPLNMDKMIEDYIIYATEEQVLDVIRKHESTEVLRTLIIHGFDISLDEVRDIYCPLSRRNECDVCINVIRDIELDSNLTFYLYNDLDEQDDEEWEETLAALEDDMWSYIEDYKALEELDDEDIFEMLPFLLGDEDADGESIQQMIKKVKDKEESAPPPVLAKPQELKDEEPRRSITCAYDYDGYIAINKLDEDLYTIEDDDYEVVLTADQIDFLFQQYNRIKDKPVK